MRTFSRNNNGSLFLTFILLVAIAAIFMSFFYILIGRIQNLPLEKNRVRAFYIAEAGIQKAIWNLTTPTGLGGQGSTWRTTGITESFSGGQYTVSVIDGASGSVIITSTGEAAGQARSLQQRMSSVALPVAFNYAIYNNGNFTLAGLAKVTGPIFANGNVNILTLNHHPVGGVYLSPGHTLTVNGTPTPPTEILDPAPGLPSLDTSYYDEQIVEAGKVPSGNKSYKDYNLNGGTLYVNGNLSINGNITGGGVIAATGKVNMLGGANVSPDTKIISNGKMTIGSLFKTTNFQEDTVLYSATSISDYGSNRIKGSVIAPKITLIGDDTIYGILYSWDVAVTVIGVANIYGAVVNPATSL